MYSGKVNEDRIEGAVFNYVLRKDDTKIVPSIGDIIKPKVDRFTYILSTELIKSNFRWLKDKNAYVLGVLVNYDALFIQIRYEK